jgi:hypothetical protein
MTAGIFDLPVLSAQLHILLIAKIFLEKKLARIIFYINNIVLWEIDMK